MCFNSLQVSCLGTLDPPNMLNLLLSLRRTHRQKEDQTHKAFYTTIEIIDDGITCSHTLGPAETCTKEGMG